MNYTENYANDGIVRIGAVMTIWGAAVVFIAGSTGALAESGMASVYAYSGSKTASGERANPGDPPLHIARWHLARTCA
jgi:rare lipoprotein A (peptidoglycan hydrolase)